MSFFRADRPLIMAHRGALRYAPENTLAAFWRALDLGADGIELDVQLSADDAVVVIHDFTLDRTTDGHGPVRTQPLAALQRLDAGGWFDPAFRGQRIPTLDAVLRELPATTLFNIELKPLPLATLAVLAKKTVALVRKQGVKERVLYSSFDPRALWLLWWHGAPRRRLALLRENDRFAARLAGTLGAWFAPYGVLNPWEDMTDAGLVALQHARGRPVMPWNTAANTEEEADLARLLALGVDGIITNRPGFLRDMIEERRHAHHAGT